MKLYTKSGACSTAVHIDLCWTGQPFDVEVMDAERMKAPAFRALNPAGSVPVLVDGDFVLTQNAAIVGYIADSFPQAGLAGDGSARQRGEATRWLSFVNSDLHPAFRPLFAPALFIADPAQHEALAASTRKRLRGLYETADARLDGRDWLAGFRSFADPYLFVTLSWAERFGVDLAGLDRLAGFRQRMQADAGVQRALRTEGLA
ncbi:glutathione S-transferase [Pseudoxanthomonas broegbernensis]|uniref:Glutathione S-transferase n=1 Tax=Pseudoxanthomonas broegbernensis TaxID=83619 RepID=A0A7V8K6M8_9GAMM|nr:glutathione S-transferase N-terminal domain-containing protein [Pseudoxanthomonas broegbernensis]KAF1685475.1 glutathione S-transferase [Pseudoxanthomonas broegbernensis]MBB6064389.1 glutathione S-transferase [Pseudoxanthomonas broegbernensis]